MLKAIITWRHGRCRKVIENCETMADQRIGELLAQLAGLRTPGVALTFEGFAEPPSEGTDLGR